MHYWLLKYKPHEVSFNHERAYWLYQRFYKTFILLFVFLASTSKKYTYNHLQLVVMCVKHVEVGGHLHIMALCSCNKNKRLPTSLWTAWKLDHREVMWRQGRMQPVRLGGGGDFSNIWHSSLIMGSLLHKRDVVYFTTLLWQNNGQQNWLISRMLFSELFKMIVKKVTFGGFREDEHLNHLLGSTTLWRR